MKTSMSLPFPSYLSFLCGTCCVLALAACGPRGETKSLEQVLRGEKERFFVQAEIKLPDDVRAELTQAATALEDLDGEGQGTASQSALDTLVLSLRSLQTRAGYTTRPALAELLKQWRTFRERNIVSGKNVQLVAARTYGLLTSELRGVKFALKERELKQ